MYSFVSYCGVVPVYIISIDMCAGVVACRVVDYGYYSVTTFVWFSRNFIVITIFNRKVFFLCEGHTAISLKA